MIESTSTPPLFTVLPDGLFGPLASPNRHHHWHLLCRLFEEFFGPDAPMPPSIGLQRREITSAIERYLLTDDPWEDEDGVTPDTPLAMRAANLYDRFRDAGWLRQERIGAREMVSMTPVVSQFIATLVEFTERGPTFLSAKIRSIELQLLQVVEGKAGGDMLDEAALQARQLLSNVAAISVQVRDLMPELSRAESTASFARQLFERYVGKLFVGDYADLHKDDHPLARRTSILTMAREIEHSSLRGSMIQWYSERTTGGDSVRAEQRLLRNLRRLQEIDRIDEYLQRLDDDIRQANRRALAFLDYRLRTPDRLDKLLRRACRGVLSAPGEALRLPVAPGHLLEERRLRPPVRRPQPIPRTANSTAPPTPEQIARLNLLRQMKRVRLVLPEDLVRYLDRHWDSSVRLDSQSLRVDSIEDFRAYQTLVTLALRSHRAGGLRRDDPLHRMLCGFRIELVDGERIRNDHLHSPRFVLHRTRKAA
ncbi:Wadjet anti-phage system protein JetA family protein [Marilutibacter alkalisoli]|uniref:Wadjet anti-phage system protein JetA family protein n=1 Tax=Marilutibacter alkalisoli TaxID=2591633 RepID=UPI001FC8F019|nr:Wadjet anti-phage system protein JetA family protein [Lysobacter alkalisoli]